MINSTHYKETILEQWINDHYRSHRIMDPGDLADLDRVADLFGVDLVYVDCNSFSDNEDRVVFLDRREEPCKARIVFFHELCHVLRHAGDQRRMPCLFKDAQEVEADQFTLYASMPFYLVEKLHMPEKRAEAVELVSTEFRVTTELADKRIDQICRRVLQSQLQEAALKTSTEPETETTVTEPTEWSPETKRILRQLQTQLMKKNKHFTKGGTTIVQF